MRALVRRRELTALRVAQAMAVARRCDPSDGWIGWNDYPASVLQGGYNMVSPPVFVLAPTIGGTGGAVTAQLGTTPNLVTSSIRCSWHTQRRSRCSPGCVLEFDHSRQLWVRSGTGNCHGFGLVADRNQRLADLPLLTVRERLVKLELSMP